MTEHDVHNRIEQALADRRAEQRPFVERLAESWDLITRRVDELDECLQQTLRSVRAAGEGGDRESRMREALAEVVGGRDGAPPDVAVLRMRLDDVRVHLEGVLGRVRRETVNIGVIGVTKAGKSTLLRTITRLPETVIPTTEFHPTTAAASRIYHTRGTSTAVLDLHTWESFRDGYLAQLHDEAGLGPAPLTPDTFRTYRYARPGSDDAGAASTDDVVRKLIAARDSFRSYEGYLCGSARTLQVDFTDLRPFVAYPDPDRGDAMDNRPYHAVRSVRIEQPFPEEAATSLGLIDLPGAGEAGLDVDQQFVRRVENEIDLLLMVKRPLAKDAGWFAPDSDVLRLADTGRGGAALHDFFVILLNRDEQNDPTGKFFDKARVAVQDVARDRSLSMLTARAQMPTEVQTDVVVPIVRHLATTLARMDRARIDAVLDEARRVAADVTRFAEGLAARAERWVHELPNQDFLLRDLAKQLMERLAEDLLTLRDEYDNVVAAGAADEALERGITDAVGQARHWVNEGLGRGSRAEWLASIKGKYTVGWRYATQAEYYRAKAEITQFFADIDVSLQHSVDQLMSRVAACLRANLTDQIVPDGPNALEHVQNQAWERMAHTLCRALEQLRRLRIDYGSIVLRVTRPILREIDAEDPATRSSNRNDAGPAAVPATPPPSTVASALVRVAAEQFEWQVQPGGGRRRVPVPTPPPRPVSSDPPPAPVAGRSSEPPASASYGATAATATEERKIQQGTQRLYDELTAAATRTIDALEVALQAETQVMVRALAAAADQFFDTVIRTNDISREYELLCGPKRRDVWPNAFDGGAARLAADLSGLSEQARAVTAATTAVAGSWTVVRSPAS